MRSARVFPLLLAAATSALAQPTPDFLSREPASLGEGWAGFTDIVFLGNAFMTLTLATLLGAAIAYHPRLTKAVDTLEEIEAPKVFVLYAVIGALIGIMVVKYGLIVGFVLFGIGGLIRFRTVLTSAKLTGHVIFVTLIGLSCGLDLPHVAVLATLFGFALLFILDARQTFCMEIRAIPDARFAEATAAYRKLLLDDGCEIVAEKKKPESGRLSFLFQTKSSITRAHFEALIEEHIEPALCGSVDLDIE